MYTLAPLEKVTVLNTGSLHELGVLSPFNILHTFLRFDGIKHVGKLAADHLFIDIKIDRLDYITTREGLDQFDL